MGLHPFHTDMTARPPKITQGSFRGSGKSQTRFYLNFTKIVPTNRKPVERQGRKVMGLHPFHTDMTARLPKTSNQDFERSTNAGNLGAQVKEFLWHPDRNLYN
jgi:hypothetical protein